MKPVKIICLLLIAIPLLTSSCLFRPIGKCTYGDNKAAKGIVTIESIEKKEYGRDTIYLVRVKGFFSRTFRMTPERYHEYIVEPGHAVGAELKGYVLSGGPCPPQFWIGRSRK